MMLCWNKGKTSIIHDHSNSECWVRVVQGDCLEERFLQAGDDAPLVQESLTTYPAGAVTHISGTTVAYGSMWTLLTCGVALPR